MGTILQHEIGDLAPEDYERFRRLVYAKSGINLGSEKVHLVRARLGKRVRNGGFASYRAYYDHVSNDQTGAELSALLDAISTNTTTCSEKFGTSCYSGRSSRN